MAYKHREEIVGKRFLSVSGFNRLKQNKISEWGWRAGVIRAATHRDNDCPDLQVLVEYDDVEWQRREWLSPHRDAVFSFFLIEKGLFWCDRPDPKHTSLIAIDHHNNSANNNHQPRINGKPLRGSQAAACTVPWPALTFYPLVARAELPEETKPVEFMQDRRLDFVDYSKLKPFLQENELTRAASSTTWASAVRQWAEMQDSQSILLTTPSVLVGYRVQVYRAEGTTQWYTAVIVNYNESSRDLTVTDDTVLEEHSEDPCLVQMRLIGDGIATSIMRGENVGITPRRSRSSTVLSHALVMPRIGRRSRGRPGSATQLKSSLRSHSLVSQPIEKEKSSVRNNRKRRTSEGSTRDKNESSESVLQSRQEDRENKGPQSGKPNNRTSRTAVLEETNASPTAVVTKLRQRRVPGVKSNGPVAVESALAQRPVRRKTRLETKLLEERSEPQTELKLTRKERQLNLAAIKAAKEEDSVKDSKTRQDSLIKRLRSSLLADKRRGDRKTKLDAVADSAQEDQQAKTSPLKLEPSLKSEKDGEEEEQQQQQQEKQQQQQQQQEETSDSRERDREPEPPPSDTAGSGETRRPVVKSEPKPENESSEGASSAGSEGSDARARSNGDLHNKDQNLGESDLPSTKIEPPSSSQAAGSRQKQPEQPPEQQQQQQQAEQQAERQAEQQPERQPEQQPEPLKGAAKSEQQTEERDRRKPQPAPGALTRKGPDQEAPPNLNSKELLVGSSSRDPGTVLDRLSSLSAGGRSLLLQHQQEEQERSRHNESPVILVERLNKPPSQPSQPPAQHHPHQQPAQHHLHHHPQPLHHPPYHPQHPLLHRYPIEPPPGHHHFHNPHLLTQASLLEVQQQQQQPPAQTQPTANRTGDDTSGGSGGLMEVETGGGSSLGNAPGSGQVPPGAGGPAARASAGYGDSGSDSGVSSLRSTGSGDERSGSRSSALSSEEATATTGTSGPSNPGSSTPNPVPGTASATPAPARVWHVQSVQHTSLLMAHPSQSPGAPVPVVGYQASPGPPPAPHHHPGLAQEMIWRPPRYLPLPPGLAQQPTLGEVLERDRHERLLRERREAEVRELESREREAKEREKIEKERAEQAVHKHFEESFRLAQQRKNMPWNSFIPLAPPSGSARSHAGLHHHPGAAQQSQVQHPSVGPSQQQQQQQQQQREREREQRDREEREHRERERQLAAQAAAAAERSQQEANEYAAQQSLAYLRAAAVSQSVQQQQQQQQVSRPSSVPGKVEYPPPPAHSRSSKSSSSTLSASSRLEKQQQQPPAPTGSPQVVHPGLPKAEPNVSLFGYSSYQPSAGGFVHELKPGKSSSSSGGGGASGKSGLLERDHHHVSARPEALPNPPPLLSDHKSSVIVKNEGSREPQSAQQQQQHAKQSVVAPAHSPSPKMMSYLNVSPVAVSSSQHKSPYECRSPTQSPHAHHHHHHHHHLQNDPSQQQQQQQQQSKLVGSAQPGHHGRPGSAHHPVGGLQHPGVNRHSPQAQQPPSQQSQQSVSQLPHPSPPEPRYPSRPEPQLAYPPHPAKSPYSAYPLAHHPHQPSASPTSHYAAPTASKPKVSSPAPSHIYGKPSSGIMTGTPVCRASDTGPSNSIGGSPASLSSSLSSGSSSSPSASATAASSVPLPLTSKAGASGGGNSISSSSGFQPIGHHPTSVAGSHFVHLAPPPAHSSRSPYDSRAYGSPLGAASKALPPPPSIHSAPSISKLPSPLHLLPPNAALVPIARPPPGIVHPVAHHQQSQSPLGVVSAAGSANNNNNNFQTQPLDLGVERSGSPKRKSSTPQGSEPVSLEVKKRRIEETSRMTPTTPPMTTTPPTTMATTATPQAQSAQSQQPQSQPQPQPQPQPPPPQQQQQQQHPAAPSIAQPSAAASSPVLSRVSEPSPLIASAATSITTVVNAALLTQQSPNSQSQVNVPSVSPAPRTASGDGSVRPSSAGSVGSLPSAVNPAALTPSASASPVPSTAPSPAPSAPGTPAKPDSDKSNSPAPARPPSTTSYQPVHKLKKAWLQRHSGEDGTEDTSNVVGSGSCLTLPLNIGNKQTNGKDNNGNNSTSSTSLGANASATSVSSASSTNTTTSTTSLPSAVNSIHNVGSMAVNSISKSKVSIKARKTPIKESMNGHTAATATPNSESLHEDSSNSEPERKAPPKRKPSKVKRKKGATWKQQTTVQEQRRRKKQKQGRGSTAAGSESSNESEAGSVSDSSEQRFPVRAIMQISTIDTYKSSGNGNKKVPKKRGRKPRSTKDIKTKEEEEEEEEDYQPRQKKKRIDNSKSSGGSNKNKKRKNNRISTMEDKPDEEKLIKTGQSWIQDDICIRYSCTRISKCRECRLTPNQRDKMCSVRSVTVFCRFYAFRRMQYTKSGTLVMAGFNDPFIDADENDIQLWLPGKDNRLIKRDKYTEETQKDSKKDWDKGDFDIELAYQIIRQVGDQFCDLIHQEKRVFEDHLKRELEQPVIWKRVVKGVREMCDLCDTTLFNYHWACSKCGFVVCIDCYEARKNKNIVWTESGKGRDKYAWLLCANRQTHVPEQLLLTQIIPADCLIQIDQRLHDCRNEWGIPKHCSCDNVPSKPVNENLRSLIKGDLVSIVNGNIKQEIKQEKQRKRDSGSSNSSESGSRANGEDKNSPLNWLADVALQNQDKNESDSDSDSDEDQDGNHSTLRELLIRPAQKTNGSGSNPNSPDSAGPNANAADSATTVTTTAAAANSTVNSQNNIKSSKKSKMDTLNEVISSVIEHSVKKEEDGGIDDEKPRELKHFVRRYKCPQRGREPLPIRIMTLTESKLLYPEVPHSWLCDGKLLRLQDPNNPKNYRIFQDQWKRGQPVIVSDVHKHLDKDLWHPDSFSKDFGDQKNDLINCMTGNLVPKQPMWKFWEGFEHSSKRLKDEQGNAMLLKLKDWPSRGDFADILPTRFADLMKCVPLSEYTHRYGRLNLTSRLPDTFTRPDLGPKMYNAYGSALYPDKGTTNLHLDVSDAVNVMVYVGISKDGDRDEHIKEAFKAIDEAGCDILTRRRVREKNEVPGALWHIYAARDADKIRDMLNAVALERGARLEPHHDPIHDQSFYLDGPLRDRLYREYGVEGYAIVQCLGDAVFVPAGAPHQVRNLHNCIKVAEDFVSPENISHCFHLTQEFRALSDTHTNHEDKLQIKNIIYHAVKDSLTALETVKEETLAKVKNEKSSNTTETKPKIKAEKSDGT